MRLVLRRRSMHVGRLADLLLRLDNLLLGLPMSAVRLVMLSALLTTGCAHGLVRFGGGGGIDVTSYGTAAYGEIGPIDYGGPLSQSGPTSPTAASGPGFSVGGSLRYSSETGGSFYVDNSSNPESWSAVATGRFHVYRYVD